MWGHAAEEVLDNEALINEQYTSIRPAPATRPARTTSPRASFSKLLDAPGIGMGITESYAMLPTAAVSGFYFSHPQAQYFAVGKVSRDQVEDYAKKRGAG